MQLITNGTIANGTPVTVTSVRGNIVRQGTYWQRDARLSLVKDERGACIAEVFNTGVLNGATITVD